MLDRATTLINQIFYSKSNERADTELTLERYTEATESEAGAQGSRTPDEELAALRARALRIRAAERELRAEGKELQREIHALERRRQQLVKQRRKQERQTRREQAKREHDQARLREALLEQGDHDDGRPDLFIVKSPLPAPGCGAEQRAQRRIAMDVGVSMRSAHNFYTGVIRNISEGGLFISTFEVFAIGTVLDLSIRLCGQPPIEVKGEVRWSRPYDERKSDLDSGIGVELLDLGEPERATIARFIDLRQPLIHEVRG